MKNAEKLRCMYTLLIVFYILKTFDFGHGEASPSVEEIDPRTLST